MAVNEGQQKDTLPVQQYAWAGGKPVKVVSDAGQKRVEYSGGKPIYVGISDSGTATSGTWTITKYTWSGDDMTIKQTAEGSWDNRASLTYS